MDTPLHIAAQNGYIEVCRVLLANNASTSVENSNHLTPCDLAFKKGHKKVYETLVSKGLSYNERDSGLTSSGIKSHYLDHGSRELLTDDI